MAYALEVRDHETKGHCQRVTTLTILLAKKLGVSAEQLIHVKRGALLHDVGKMAVPDNILFKPGKLSNEEWAIMKMHPKYAIDMLTPVEFLKPALNIPHYHHEKWDGSGYPYGLKGEEIPFEARIFSAVDVWDALLCVRPYKQAWEKDEAMNYIQQQSSSHFDPQVIIVFEEVVKASQEFGLY
jgi:putative nucleotidyltransferase with HDIG domain